MTIAIYPGSFDPITNGHLDIATRASKLFEKLTIGVYDIPDKPLLFTTKERVDLVQQSINQLPNVDVESYSGLTITYARKKGARVMVRGLRIGADFEREFEMAMMNKELGPELELLCLMSCKEFQFLSSSLLKEVAALGGDIRGLVPKPVATALLDRVGSIKPNKSVIL